MAIISDRKKGRKTRLPSTLCLEIDERQKRWREIHLHPLLCLHVNERQEKMARSMFTVTVLSECQWATGKGTANKLTFFILVCMLMINRKKKGPDTCLRVVWMLPSNLNYGRGNFCLPSKFCPQETRKQVPVCRPQPDLEVSHTPSRQWQP